MYTETETHTHTDKCGNKLREQPEKLNSHRSGMGDIETHRPDIHRRKKK